MSADVTQIAVLGSTGSIGRSALDVIGAAPERLRALALTAHSQTEMLEEQAHQHNPRWVVVTDQDAAQRHTWKSLPKDCQLCVGPEAIERIVTDPDINVVLSAIVGAAGLNGTWAALEAGKQVALANKETLVVAGPLIMQLASRSGARLVPVDSEHSAIFQALQAGRRDEVKRIILTASGGPFRHHTLEQLKHVTLDQALQHPNWKMGKKITIDSATMMNKALEIIEARWLFDLRADQIDVVIHPQSIVHSLVEFVDGSVVAQLSPPDMRLPIQYALSYPRRMPGVAAQVDWRKPMQLDFEPPDLQRFGALELGLEAARAGGTAGAVLNGANEAAVAGLLAGELSFSEIVPACRAVLEHHTFDPQPSLTQLWAVDRWAREEIARWVCA